MFQKQEKNKPQTPAGQIKDTVSIHSVDAAWSAPLKKMMSPKNEWVGTSVRIRFYSGNSEEDVTVRLPKGKLNSTSVINAWGEKIQLTRGQRRYFSLWIVARDVGKIQTYSSSRSGI